jgi:hypothetical protein
MNIDPNNSDSSENKRLLLWPTVATVPDEIRALFTMIFTDIFDLIKYIYKVLAKTDTFHLIVPFDCLQVLLNDAMCKFPQVVLIDVVYENASELGQMTFCYEAGLEKLKLCLIKNLSKIWDQVILVERLVISEEMDRSIKKAINSMIAARIASKALALQACHSRIRKRCSFTSLHGFPVQNSLASISDYTCPSCQLLYVQPYQLECGHQLCQACVHTKQK